MNQRNHLTKGASINYVEGGDMGKSPKNPYGLWMTPPLNSKPVTNRRSALKAPKVVF